MPLFTDISSERLIRALQKHGFWVSKDSGKHTGMSNGTRKVTIPRHPRVNPHTLKSIIRSAGLTDEEFKELL